MNSPADESVPWQPYHVRQAEEAKRKSKLTEAERKAEEEAEKLKEAARLAKYEEAEKYFAASKISTMFDRLGRTKPTYTSKPGYIAELERQAKVDEIKKAYEKGLKEKETSVFGRIKQRFMRAGNKTKQNRHRTKYTKRQYKGKKPKSKKNKSVKPKSKKNKSVKR